MFLSMSRKILLFFLLTSMNQILKDFKEKYMKKMNENSIQIGEKNDKRGITLQKKYRKSKSKPHAHLQVSICLHTKFC